MGYGLTFDTLDFSPGNSSDEGYWFEVLGANWSQGAPQPVVATINSMLQDGSMVEKTGDDNREQGFVVVVCGADLLSLAAGEQALALAVGKRTTLAYTPPDGIAPTTVFDVLTSRMEQPFDDLGELQNRRAYTLAFTCLPFGRSVDEVSIPALTVAAGADTLVNACDSATGWANSTLGATAVVPTVDTTQKVEGSGSIKFAATPRSYTAVQHSGSLYKWSISQAVTLSGLALDFTTTPYLEATFWVRHSSSHAVTAYADGVVLPQVAKRARGADWVTYYFQCSDAAVSALTFHVTQDYVGNYDPNNPNTEAYWVPAEWLVRVDDVRRSGAIPGGAATGRQSTRIVSIAGSARTPGSLAVSATAGLGDVLAYTSPALSNGYTPDVSRWRVSGPAVTVDAARISGNRVTMGTTPEVFEFPTGPLPRGGYLLVARLAYDGTGARRLTYTVSTKVGGTLQGSKTYTSRRINPMGAGVWQFVTLGAVTLPPTDVPAGSAAMVQLSVTEASGINQVLRDEFYVLSLADRAAHSIVACGAGAAALGTANSKLWIDAPTIDRPVPAAWLGVGDKADSYHAGSVDVHTFAPPETVVFVANSGAANPEVSFRHPKLWHTNAAS